MPTEFICETCGTQYQASIEPPPHCIICEDDRQYVGFNGQRWTTLEALSQTHQNQIATEEPHVTSIRTVPAFAIDQRAFLIESPSGNVLWDCIALLDDATIAAIRQRGGLSGIAISHPHYYTTMAKWSAAFGDIPIYLHADDRKWVVHPDPQIQFWSGEQLRLHDGLTLILGGGHFDGGTLLHWPGGAGGKGVLFTGDIIQVVLDRRWVSFMYSYPNFIPLHPDAVRRLARAVASFEFDRIHGAFHLRSVLADARAVLSKSVDRYLRSIGANTG